MTSITALLKNTLTLNCYLLTQTVFMKNFFSINIYLTLVTIRKFFDQAKKNLLVK